MVIIEAGEEQFLQYQVVIVKLLFTRFINKQKNQIKSREKFRVQGSGSRDQGAGNRGKGKKTGIRGRGAGLRGNGKGRRTKSRN